MVATSLLWFRDDTNASLSDTIKIGAFADSRVGKVADSELVMPDAPFSRLLRASLAASTPAPPPQPQPEPAPPAADSNGNTAPSKPAEDDFLLHDLKTPFAGYNGNKEELGAFFNEFRSAPPLQGDDANTTVADHLGDLTTQLQQFELDLQQYDKLITSLCHRDNNN